jgi:tetratricopeptide (TPR) repeat protein
MTLTNEPRVSEAVRQRFVGRAEALDMFYLRFAYRHMKNGVYYYGHGGLGKSWLLQKIILDNQGDPTRVVTDIIDFFDTQNHSVRGLQVTIKSQLQNPEAFRPYDEVITSLDAMQSKGGEEVHPSAIASLEARANRLFIECCQRAIIGREVILLFDTFERVQQRHVGQWLLQEFLPQVRGLIIAVAGRPEPSRAQMPDNIASYELKGLELEEARNYVRRQLPGATDEFIETVWKRTGGTPLIIDLILDLPEPAREQFVAELSSLKDDEQIQDSPALQRGLVGQFSFRDDSDRRNRVVWAMAYLKRRFDVPMLRYVVKNLGEKWFKPGDYDAIFEELCRSIYVKEYPHRQSHLLHDEVQRMVAEYVLTEAADSGMQEPLFALIVNRYYPEAIERAENQDLARQLQSERLGYILDREPGTGLEQYETYRSGIIEEKRDYDFEGLLWGEVREHLDSFEDKGYQVCFDRGQWLHKHSLFRKADEHYRQMVNRFEVHQVGTRQSLGFMLMRQGKISEAQDVFEESRKMVKEDDFDTIAMIENNLGQANRVAGQWDRALEHYAQSFRAATMGRNPARMVSVYINRGYLYSLHGQYSNAKQQCERAIELLESLPTSQENTQRAIFAWMNLGTAYRHSGEYPIAAQHYRKSLELAQENKNREAICDALQHIGINEHLWGRTLRRDERELAEACKHQLQAWQHLAQALEMARLSDWRNAIADGLNRLGKVYREIYRLQTVSQLAANEDVQGALQKLQQAASTYQLPFEVEYELDLLTVERFVQANWLGKAARLFEVSALIADEVNNFHRALESLTEVARALEELGMEDKVPIVIRRIERIKGYDYQPALFGAIGEVILGSLDFKQRNLDRALERYANAYADIGEQSGYAFYLLTDGLRDLEWRLRMLAPEIALAWCDALETEWLRRSVLTRRPEMRDTLERIRFEAIKRQMEHKDGH